MKAIELETKFLKEPIGLGIKNPRLNWKTEDGVNQTAFQVILKDKEDNVFWDSGKVLSSSMHVICPKEIPSRTYIHWEVILWNEKDQKGESSSSFFETGLLKREDFHAHWISGNYHVNGKNRYPIDCFKKTFFVKDISQARLYVTSLGLYEIQINGRRVGDFVLAPGYTDYKKRIQLQTYDVTSYLKVGENTITAELADGWYRGSVGAWGLKNQYGKQTKLYVQLEIRDTCGQIQEILSDKSWSWSNDGERRFADNKDGEILDLNLAPSYSKKAKGSSISLIPTSSNNVPVKEHERLAVKNIIKTPTGSLFLDFGQNIAGYIEFSFMAKKGEKIHLRFGEMLTKEGEFTQKNIQCSNKKGTKITPKQEIYLTCKEGLNHYKTKFAVFGFQYVLVETNIPWKKEDFTAIAVYSDMKETLSFSCSNPLINQFVENTRWSAKNNHLDIPTDCPTRERHGWTGDAEIFTNTASYFFEYMPFARKYVQDMVDEQKRNGVYRQISPMGGTDFYMKTMDGSAGWSDAGVLIPYRLYLRYGDERILSDNFSSMKKYVEYKIKTLGKVYLTSRPTGIEHKYRKYISNYGQSYGEWAEPSEVHPFEISDFVSPHPEETTAYIYYLLKTFEDVCRILKKEDDRKRYEALSLKVKEGYQALLRSKKFSLDTDRQAKLVRPLYFHLLDEKNTEYAKKRLIQALDNYKWRVGTGFLSTPFILYVLEDINLEYAYRLLENEEMPGWLFMPKIGANTIWESWEGTSAQKGVASLDHYSKGAVCEWIFSRMCGINVLKENAFLIEPKVGGHVTSASCSYDSIYGKVSVSWERNEKQTKYKITIPSNTTAHLLLPHIDKILIPGEYEFIEE